MGKSRGASPDLNANLKTSIELERKFAVPDGAVTPSFEGLAAIARIEKLPTRAMEAVYYDTRGHDLSAHRITLRRRTGGPDAGWHVKLPDADGGAARTEIQYPLQDGLPDDLRDVLLAIVRDRPLLPIARIANDRDVIALVGVGGAVLAEFCDDRVSAGRLDSDAAVTAEQTWREWELEITDSAATDAGALLDRLTNRVLDAGGTPARHGSKLAKVLGEPAAAAVPADAIHRAVATQIDRLLEADRAVRADDDDAVHQMRVATRQIRSLLQTSADAFGLTGDAWILGELRELAAVLGVARDAEVLAERYRDALAALPPELVRGPVGERLVEGGRRRYQAGWRRSLTAMRSTRYFRLLDALDDLVATPPAGDGSRDTPTAVGLTASYRKVRKTAKRALAEGTPQPEPADADGPAAPIEHDHDLHRVRKAAKRLRYVAEATGARKIAKRSKDIQTLLGDHQDSVVGRQHLLEQADAAHAAGEDTFTYGVLYQREADLAGRCEAELPAALKALRHSFQAAR